MKWLFLLLLAVVIFGGAAFFSYDLFVKPERKIQQEKSGEIPVEPIPDVSLPDFQAAAKEIEAARLQKEAEQQAVLPKAFRMTCSEPERETEKVEQLYQAFLQAKQQAGEHTGKLSRSSFNEFVLKKTKELQKQKNCKDVEYVVETVEGQVKLKALVKS